MLNKILSILIIIAFAGNPAFANLKELRNEKLQKRSPKMECLAAVDYRLDSANINWWDNYSDPLIKEYIYKAIKNNHDLKKAALKSEEYRQMVKSTFAGELPTLTLSPTFARIKTANNQLADIEVITTRTNIYAIPLVASYELDYLGKNHDKTKAAKKDLEIQEYTEKAAYITMASDVASLYINIIKMDKIIETEKEIVKVREKIYELTKERNKIGLASTYDVTDTDKMHTISQIRLNNYLKLRSVYLNQFAVYVGECPSGTENLKRGKFDDLKFNGKIPTSIPSETALMRPDLMKAEAELKKAKINVSIARKEFLPSVPILGATGYNSLLLENLFNWENIFAFVGISAIQKIYSGGRLTANLRIKKLQYEQLFENYKQADLTAIQEINDSLCIIKYDTQKDRDNLKKYLLEANNFKLINERYKAGIISYLQMIQYKESLLTLQNDKDNSKSERLIDYMTLYKATGSRL